MVPARPPPYADRLHSTQGATIRTLLDDLTRKYEGMGELMFATPDTIRDLLTFSRMAGMSIVLDSLLEDGDVIALFPPITMGRHILSSPNEGYHDLLSFSGIQ
jgi:molybdopterin converting factor small subunit